METKTEELEHEFGSWQKRNNVKRKNVKRRWQTY